jgi:hypothetical protein
VPRHRLGEPDQLLPHRVPGRLHLLTRGVGGVITSNDYYE